MPTPAARLRDRSVLADLVAALVAQGGSARIVVHGGSMGTALPSGSEIEIVPARDARVVAGAIVAVRGPEGLLVHRVVDLDGARWLRGDAMSAPDGPLDRFELLGEVVSIRPPTRLSSARRLARSALRLVRSLNARGRR